MSWTRALPLIAIMAGSTYLVRVIPMVLFRRPITSRFVKAFLYYVPYAVLAAMTIPGILSSTPNGWATAAGTAAALLLAWNRQSLLVVSLGAAAASLVTMLLL